MPGALVLAAAAADGGVHVRLAPGWQVLASTSTQIVAAKGNAVFTVDITQPPADAATMIQDHLNGLVQNGVQDLQITKPQQIPLPNANFVAGQQLNLRGVIASQQGGSVPVEGFAFYLVRRDGVGITAAGIYRRGELDRTPTLVDEYGLMLGSVYG